MNISFPKIQTSYLMGPVLNHQQNASSVSFGSNNADVFLPSQRFQNCHSVENFLKTVRKVTPKEYEKLSPEQIEDFFYYNLDNDLRVAVDDNLMVALPLKEFLDKKYGEDQYVFVSIGTSPAPVGRVLEFSGVETKYLPISALIDVESYQEIVSSFGFDSYEKFLKEQGISEKDIARSRKTFVFYDFTSTGTSLNLFRDLMVNHFKLPTDKIDFRSLNEDIYYSCSKAKNVRHLPGMERLNWQLANDYVTDYLEYSVAECFGGIAHLNYWNLSNIQDCKTYSDDKSKTYNLYVMYKLDKMGLLKYNPKNGASL